MVAVNHMRGWVRRAAQTRRPQTHAAGQLVDGQMFDVSSGIGAVDPAWDDMGAAEADVVEKLKGRGTL